MTTLTLNERLIAPGATTGESLACYLTAAAGAIGAVLLALDAELPGLAVAVIALVAFDLCGGAVVNSTSAAKRHFHRPGRTRWHHLGFVAIHVQPFLLALVVPGFGWAAAGFVYALALGGAVAVLAAPVRLRKPVAFAWVTLAMLAPIGLPAALVWVTPVLLIKLLLAHLQPE
ncbi:hypothetical protein H0264_00950 [Nocardia huaxiensis]|uniref:Uncharacterized protein n=1 Tax=Nocardia huaxiensis TaxID=2755382 RepID=A0A7D6ZQ60_9NOCA|nr:hypothetical protein [Nocardia huaxiensis]QLY31005.1 hypothetical protein H0264_00950 [Nocardia huaxiensis]